MSRLTYLIIIGSCLFAYLLIGSIFMLQEGKTPLFHVFSTLPPGSAVYRKDADKWNGLLSFVHKFFDSAISTNSTSGFDHIPTDSPEVSCTPVTKTKSQVKFYKPSSNHSYHYEYQYELNKRSVSSSESRLILLLTGRSRVCADWWDFSVGDKILSQMRSSGFSILTICTSRKYYDISVPIQKNLDVYWIYTTLQIWMNDVYYRQFQHYPRLYLFGISEGSRFASLLSRVLPVQAQILYIYPGHRPSLLIRSSYEKAMQNRLIADHNFANWFYFDYCSKGNLTTNQQCPFHHLNKNYFNSVPPIYFVRQEHETKLLSSHYHSIIADIKKDAFNLGGTLLTHDDAIKFHVTQPLNITPDSMKENFNKWSCKPWSSRFFYEHVTNSAYNTLNGQLRTCWCTQTNFRYFEQYPNVTKTWSATKQDEYVDYVNDIQRFSIDFCETVCGPVLANHAMTSHHINNTLRWLNNIDHYRSLYKIEDFVNRPLRLWMYDKYELVHNVTYLTYQTSMKTSCGRQYGANQMYSSEYFLQDFFQRLNGSHRLSRNNLIWNTDPLLADYYIIPHDYTCIAATHHRANLTDLEYRSFYTRLNQNYLLPLLRNVRTSFAYWNMTSGSNHIIAFTLDKNMGIVDDSLIQDNLKNVVQLGFTGFRQDLLPHNSLPLYAYRNVTPFYRHNYDIIVPAFNRLQWINTKPLTVRSDLNTWYEKKKTLLFFAGTINHSSSLESVRRHLLSLVKEDIGEKKRYKGMITIDEKQLNTIKLIDGHTSPLDYAESIRSSIFHLCLEGYSPWTPRLYESICLGAIPLILAESIVLPFERFIDWRSFTTKINMNNVRNIIDFVTKVDKFEEYVTQKLKNATLYFNAFRWPYSPVDDNHDRHIFLPEEDLNGTTENVFHYLSLELRCRRLEQFYGLTSNSFSTKSIDVKRQVCRQHPIICPCYEEQNSLAVEEYI